MAKSTEFGAEVDALKAALEALGGLNEEQQQFVYQTVGQRLKLSAAPPVTPRAATTPPTVTPPAVRPPAGGAANEAGMDAKQFLTYKKSGTDVERVAVLAYYLTHHKNTPHFKTADISKLNTEAAQTKLSNPAHAVANATRQNNFLAAAPKGTKQITAYGEDFVKALPDRAAADKVKAEYKKRRRRRKKAGQKKKKKATRRGAK